MIARIVASLVVVIAALLAAGCASNHTSINAQRVSPSAANAAKVQKVLVIAALRDSTQRRLLEDSRVEALGAAGEMRETAAILREGTGRSLVMLDEIGRGSSTFDGLSIAWAVAEHLHDAPGLRARVLFATHYHELADLARTKSAVRNYHFTCAEQDGEILFLRRMEPGAASRSYGIDLARTAGLPPKVIRRAREVLRNLEGGEFDELGVPRLARAPGAAGEPAQLGLFAPEPDPLHAALRALEPDQMTPLEALVALVQYFEPAKWVGRLLARRTGASTLLFRTTMEAGHGGRSGRFQRYREVAEEYAFILDQ